jgi:hypothetical protein
MPISRSASAGRADFRPVRPAYFRGYEIGSEGYWVGSESAVGILYTRNLQENQPPDFVAKNRLA